MDELPPDSIRTCEAALAYIEDMSAWYDEDVEGAPKLDFVLRIINEIDRRGELTPSERAWCEARIRERYE